MRPHSTRIIWHGLATIFIALSPPIWTAWMGVGVGVGNRGAQAKLINVTVGPQDPSVQYLPVGAWEVVRAVQGEEGGITAYAVSSEEDATASFEFRGTTLYYTTPLFSRNSGVTLTLDGLSTLVNLTSTRSPGPQGSPTPTTTLLIADGMVDQTHSLSLAAGRVDARVIGNVTFGEFMYTVDDELLPRSSSISGLETARPTASSSSTNTNVNASLDTQSNNNNRKLIIPLAVIGSLLGVLIIVILLLWAFKFPHYCCGPARKVVYKFVAAREPKRDEMGVVDLTDGEGRSSTEEGYGMGKKLPPTPTMGMEVKPPLEKEALDGSDHQRGLGGGGGGRRFKLPHLPALAALGKVKNLKFNIRFDPKAFLPHRRGTRSDKTEDPTSSTYEIDRHFELMTTGVNPPNATGTGTGSGTGPYPPPRNDSNRSFDPRSLITAANNGFSSSDLSYVTAPPNVLQAQMGSSSSPPPPLPPLPAVSPLSVPHQSPAANRPNHNNPYLSSHLKPSTAAAAAVPLRVSSSRTAAQQQHQRDLERAAPPTSPTVTVRQLALDLPYLQYLDALTVPASRISALLQRNSSVVQPVSRQGSGGAQVSGTAQVSRQGSGSNKRDGEEKETLRNVAPLSDRHLKELNAKMSREREEAGRDRVGEDPTRRRGTEESGDTATPLPQFPMSQTLVVPPTTTTTKEKDKTKNKFKLGSITGLGKPRTKTKEPQGYARPPFEDRSLSFTVPSIQDNTTSNAFSNSDATKSIPILDSTSNSGGMLGESSQEQVGTFGGTSQVGTVGDTSIGTLGGTGGGTNHSHRASSTVVGEPSPHPKKISFWGALTGSGGGIAFPSSTPSQNAVPLPLPPTPNFDVATAIPKEGRGTPNSFGDAMVVVTQPRSRTTSATNGEKGPPPSSMWKMAPMRKRHDSGGERGLLKGPRTNSNAAATAMAAAAAVAASVGGGGAKGGHEPNHDSLGSSGHGHGHGQARGQGEGKLRPLPSVAPLQVVKNSTMRELPRPAGAGAPPPATPPPSQQQDKTKVQGPVPQARSSHELQQQLHDVLSHPSHPPPPPPSPPSQSQSFYQAPPPPIQPVQVPSQPIRTQVQRVQVQPIPQRMDSGSSDSHVGGGRRPLPVPPPAAPAIVSRSPSPPSIVDLYTNSPSATPHPPAVATVPISISIASKETRSHPPMSTERANPPPPRPPPRPSLPPSSAVPSLGHSKSYRVPVPKMDVSPPQPPATAAPHVKSSSTRQEPAVAPKTRQEPAIAPKTRQATVLPKQDYQPLPDVPPSGSFSSDWMDMSFGMGLAKAKGEREREPEKGKGKQIATYEPPPPPQPSSRPTPQASTSSAPKAQPRPPPPPTSYQPQTAPTVYSTGTYEDEDGEDSIYADYEGTWSAAGEVDLGPSRSPPASKLNHQSNPIPNSTPNVQPMPPPPATAADGNPNYPDHPGAVGSKGREREKKGRTRLRPKGPSTKAKPGDGRKKEVYDPVWRPDAIGGSRS